MRFIVEDRDNFGMPSSTLELTTLAPPSVESHAETGVVAVIYNLTEKNKKRILTRQESDLLAFTNKADNKAVAYPQMEQISSFLVECFDGSKWVKSWDTAINYSLPKGVRVTVQLEEDGKPLQFTILSAPRVNSL